MTVINHHIDQRDGESQIQAMARQFCTILGEERGWDTQPELAVIIDCEHGHAGLFSLPVPATYWHATPPARVVRWLADQRELAIPDSLRTDWGGFALLHEAWIFKHQCGNGCEHLQWVQSGRSIAEHVDSREARFAYLFTPTGEVAVAMQARGDSDAKVKEFRRDAEKAPRGNIPAALWYLVDTTQRRLAAAGN